MDAASLKLLDEDEEFAFEPTPWDLAFAIGIRVDARTDRRALEELADAMLVWMDDGPELEHLTATAMSALWSDELGAMIASGLVRLSRKDDWRAAAQASLVELERDSRAAEVSKEVVRHLALQLASDDAPFLFCILCLEEHIGRVPRAERRVLALQAAILARRDAAVPRNLLKPRIAALGGRGELGTEARRLAVRRRLGRIAGFGRASLPVLAAELRVIAEEPLPDDPAADDVWQAVLTQLLPEVAMPEWN
jgi:hypothetical protein